MRLKSDNALPTFVAIILLALCCLVPGKVFSGMSRPPSVGNLYIISIGISEYKARNSYALAFCINDARAFADSLELVGKNYFDKVDKHFLFNESATKHSIESMFGSVTDSVKPQDTFVFYFSGFSNVNKDELFLFPSDATSMSIDSVATYQAITGDVLRIWFAKIQAHNKLVILDAGPSSFGIFKSYYESENIALQKLLQQNITIISVHPYDIELNEKQHGLLTYDIISGLSGPASTDVRNDGRITAWGLLTYTSRKVFEFSDTSRGGMLKGLRVDNYIGGGDFVLGITKENMRNAPQESVTEPNRGVSVISEQSTEKKETQKSSATNYALLISTDKYDNWKSLANPTYDAKTISDELKSNYGFQTDLVMNPPLDSISSKLNEYLERTYSDDDELFIFFAGHGDYNEVGREGFVVASDSKSKSEDRFRRTYLSYSVLRNVIDNIPCKHIFLALDVCYGGTFDQRISNEENRGDPGEEISKEQMLKRVHKRMKNESRLYLSSGGKEYVSDGIPNHHSPFAGKFIDILQSYGNKYGVLTYRDIIAGMERVKSEATPCGGTFGSGKEGGEFVFVAK